MLLQRSFSQLCTAMILHSPCHPPTPHPHSCSFSTGDQNTDFLKLTYGGKKNFALGKGPTLRESNCRVPQPIMTTSLELPALKSKCYMILLLCLHLIICYLVLVYTSCIHTRGLPWSPAHTLGMSESHHRALHMDGTISVGLFDSDVIETDTMNSRLSSFFKYLSADKA